MYKNAAAYSQILEKSQELSKLVKISTPHINTCMAFSSFLNH